MSGIKSSVFICKFIRCRLQKCVALCASYTVVPQNHSPYFCTVSLYQDIRVRLFCTSEKTTTDRNNEAFKKHKDRVKHEFKTYIQHNKEKLRNTEEKIKLTGNVILKDIKETKDKVKEKVEEIIEVCIQY